MTCLQTDQHLNDGRFSKHCWGFAVVCIVLGVSIAAACSCNRLIVFKTEDFTLKIKEAEVVTCRRVESLNSMSVTQVFTDEDQQICVFVRARLENIEELKEMLGPDTELPSLAFIEYYQGQKMQEFSIRPHYSPDGQVIGSYCSKVVQGSSPKGKYRVEVTLLSTEVGKVEYEIR